MRRAHKVGVVFAMFLGLAAQAALGSTDYPSRPVQMVVPWPPGGGGDIVGRYFAHALSEQLGKPMVVDNKSGASGNIGAEAGARAAADGYTLTLGVNSVAINHSLYPKISFDVTKDFAPVAMLATSPMAIVVHPSVPARTLQELIALAKEKPGALNHGSPGVGSPQHLAAELFLDMSGTKIVHVPFRGTAPSMQAILAGDIQVMFATLGAVEPHIKSGKLRALAVTERRRSAVFPDLPTVDEAGVKGYEASIWYSLLAPAKTPDSVVERLTTSAKSVLERPESRAKLESMGFQPAYASPADLARIIQADVDKWAAVIKRLGLKVE